MRHISTSGGVKIGVEKAIVHPNSEKETAINNIAILRLSATIKEAKDTSFERLLARIPSLQSTPVSLLLAFKYRSFTLGRRDYREHH